MNEIIKEGKLGDLIMKEIYIDGIPIYENFDKSKPPVGIIKLFKDYDWDVMGFTEALIVDKINEDGKREGVKLDSVSIIPRATRSND